MKNDDPLKPMSKSNILLVDDNPTNLMVLRSILDDLGQNLIEAHSGEEALRRLLDAEFAAILLDVYMPGMDGFETAMLIRGQKRTRHTPIIFQTAQDIDPSQLEQGYLLGAVDFLVKPLVPVILKAKIRGFVELFEEKQRAKREAEHLRILVEGVTDYAIFMLDAKGCVFTWNPGAQRIKQFRAEEIIGQHFSRFYTQESIDRGWPDHELRVAEKEGRFEDEGWRVRKDGTQFWANVIITALRDESGKLRGFSKITRDTTERKKAEENARRLLEEAAARRVAEEHAKVIQMQQRALAEAERRWRSLAESLPNLVWTDLPDGQCDYLSSQWGIYTGIPENELLGLAWLDRVIHPDDREKTLACWQAACADKADYDLEYRIRRHDGIYHWFKTRGVPIRDEQRRIVYWFGTCTDIEDQKQAQQALAASEERFRQLADAMPQIVWTARPDGTIDYMNRRWQEFTGLPEALGNEQWSQILHREDVQAAKERWVTSLQSGAPFEMEIRLLDRRNQTYRWHLIRTVAVNDGSGKVARWFGIGLSPRTTPRRSRRLRRMRAGSSDICVSLAVAVARRNWKNIAGPTRYGPCLSNIQRSRCSAAKASKQSFEPWAKWGKTMGRTKSMNQVELGKLHLRVARPSDNLDAVVKFYRDGLGFTVLYEFTNHDGFDGVMLGHQGASYHLEFTRKLGHKAGKAPTEDNLLVFYIPDLADWKQAIDQMERHGHRSVKSFNPYWDKNGKTFADPDGYRVVLQHAIWPG